MPPLATVTVLVSDRVICVWLHVWLHVACACGLRVHAEHSLPACGKLVS